MLGEPELKFLGLVAGAFLKGPTCGRPELLRARPKFEVWWHAVIGRTQIGTSNTPLRCALTYLRRDKGGDRCGFPKYIN